MITMLQVKKRHISVWIWKALVIILGVIYLSLGLLKTPGFWSSYLLDIAGPAWGYVVIRAHYKSEDSRFLTFRFSLEGALLTLIIMCFSIETAQYFGI